MDRKNAHNAPGSGFTGGQPPGSGFTGGQPPGSGFTGGQPPAAPDRQTDEDQQDVRRPSDTNALLLSGAPDPTWYQLPPQVPPVVAVTQDNLAQGPSMSAPARPGSAQSSTAGQTQSSPGTEANTSKNKKKPDRRPASKKQNRDRNRRAKSVVDAPDTRNKLPWEDWEDKHMLRLYKEKAKVQEEMPHFLKRTETAISRRASYLHKAPDKDKKFKNWWEKLTDTVATENKGNPSIQKQVKADLESYRARCAEDAAREAARVAAEKAARAAAGESDEEDSEESDEEDSEESDSDDSEEFDSEDSEESDEDAAGQAA